MINFFFKGIKEAYNKIKIYSSVITFNLTGIIKAVGTNGGLISLFIIFSLKNINSKF